MYIFIFLISVFISSIAQVALKSSAGCSYNSIIEEYLNPRVIIAYGIFFLSTLITIFAYKGVPLSMGPVLEASGYIWVAIMDRLILKEIVTRRKLLGLVMIIVGIIVFSLA